MGSWELGFINSPPENRENNFGTEVTYYKVPFPFPVKGWFRIVVWETDCGPGVD